MRLRKRGTIAHVTLNRPEAMNAIDREMRSELKVLRGDFLGRS